MAEKWCDVNAFYQIYPRSFMDSNGDGIGDLRGVIDKLDYIKSGDKSLGIDAIWFSPFYPSPQADMGYDVADYCDIDPIYGSLDDFKELIKKAHQRGIKVMIDFVPNHTSEQHPWFIESQSSRDNSKSDFYTWRDARADGSPPNNWLSIFGGSAWQWHEGRQQYYLHTFLKEQPDLNWDNPAVRAEMQKVLRFWLDLGVDGFRADAVRWISKDPELRDDPIAKHYKGKKPPTQFDDLQHKYSRFWKNLFPYLRELTDVVASYPNRIMVFEDYPDENYSTSEQYLGFYGVNPKVSMPFNFEGLHAKFNAESISTIVNEFQGMINPDIHTPVYCFSNHDQSRIVTRFGGEEQARLIALMQLTLPGLPVVYYGDEIGMSNTPIRFDQIQDNSVFSHNNDESIGRDPERTPMQWTPDENDNAGFSTAKPWLPVNTACKNVNVELEQQEPDSFLALYRRLLTLRSRYQILRTGEYEPLSGTDKDIFAYARWTPGKQRVLVAMNFSKETRRVKLPHVDSILCTTHPVDYPDVDEDDFVTLRPYEGVLVECGE
ncbi:Oligo-1,6-glucosidase [Candidatus Nanosynsacchari sp. TM7_G1_3_12Alb]|nr:Oligo-1,6-glucosidase [Candidatus Nanosynsacchari sp. TM7_G1_3_12Alb]